MLKRTFRPIVGDEDVGALDKFSFSCPSESINAIQVIACLVFFSFLLAEDFVE
ncbi:MAG: hypothetical protein ABGY95_01315 [Rubritalea sp.]|uniref:hypothetical protein n=1 Tax=Rubritalea sp. TaxID=2109375 RepID=UPI003242741D